MALTTWRPPVKPPVGAVDVNTSHPFGAALLGGWVFNERAPVALDVLRRTHGTYGAAAVSGIGPGGPALILDGTSNAKVNTAASTLFDTPTSTLLVIMRSTGNPGNQTVVSRRYDGGPPDKIAVMMNIGGRAASAGGGYGFYENGTFHSTGVTTDIRGDGLLHTLVGTYDGTTANYFIDGRLDATLAYTGSQPSSAGIFDIGLYNNGGEHIVGEIYLVAYARGVPLPGAQLSQEPYAFLRPLVRRRYFLPATGPTAYTLTADAGSFSLGGQAAGLLWAHLLDAAVGVYTLSGQDAVLAAGRLIAADAGLYTLGGQDATLALGRVLGAEAGSFSLDGQDAAFQRAYAILAEAGFFTLDGQDVDFAKLTHYLLTADPGLFALAGQGVTLRYSGAVTGRQRRDTMQPFRRRWSA